jgi:NAD(P)H-hydrate epimerase
MPLATVYESRYIRAIEENAFSLGLTSSKMMESAGRCVADLVIELLSSREKGVRDEKVVVLAGRGGNAGDGLVAARYLKAYGAKVIVALLFDPSFFTHPDTAVNYDLWIKDNGSVARVFTKTDAQKLLVELSDASVIIDAIFGTGVKYPLPEHVADVIEKVNSVRSALKVSIDIPSGLDPDKGIVGYPLVKADYTVAIHFLKKAYFLAPEYCGQVRVCNIGIPVAAEEFVGPGHVKNLLRMKPPDAKKGDGGRIVVIGGSVDYVGAPALSGLAALKAGADLVHVVVPEVIRSVVSSYSPSLITVPLGKEYLDWRELDKAWVPVSRADAVVIGPGMSFNEDTLAFFEAFMQKWRDVGRPFLIIDADALKCLSELKLSVGENAVVTPHRGEFDRLLQSYGLSLEGDTELKAKALAGKLGGVVLVKGPVDYICKADLCMKNKTGNPGMSTGGTGDVLTGIIAAFTKRTSDLFEASFLAAYINGMAGDLLYKKRGEFFDSRDLIDYIPLAIKSLI